jgi:hypothetical protein
VILDTSVAIEAERQQLNVAHFLKHITRMIGEREAALCSITSMEFTGPTQKRAVPRSRQAMPLEQPKGGASTCRCH